MGNIVAVAQVAVVRDGEHAAAGFLFVGVHPFPQVDGIGAAQRRDAGERLDLAGAVAVVAEDDVAMQVVALVERGPLVADEGGEAARLVVVLGGGDGLLPRAAIGACVPGNIHQLLRERCPGQKLPMMSSAASAPLPDWIMSYHLRPIGWARISGLPAKRSGKKPMLSE